MTVLGAAIAAGIAMKVWTVATLPKLATSEFLPTGTSDGKDTTVIYLVMQIG